VKITKISISGFKNYLEKREFIFGNYNIIRGENALGKSSIGDAIAWGLTGCNAYGIEKAAARIVNSRAKITEVEVNFEYRGGSHSVKRIKSGKTTDIYLDGNKTTNTDLYDKFMIGKEYFFSVFNPFYFISLSPTEAKSFLLSILQKVSDESVFEQLGEYGREILISSGFKSGSNFIDEKRKEIAETNEDIIYCHGIIDGQSNNFLIGEDEIFDETRLVELENELLIVFSEINSRKSHSTFNYILSELRFIETSLKETKDIQHNHIYKISKKLGDLNTELQEYGVENLEYINARLAYIKELTHQITELKVQAALAQLNKQNSFNIQRHREMIQLKIDETKRKIEEGTQRVKKLNLLVDLAKQFNAKKLELESKVISRYLNKVSIQFQKIVKSTGEIKDDFKILYESRELTTLSHSEKIKAGLEICSLVMQIVDVKFPIFIDDAESITNYDKPYTQIIEARVERGSDLIIESYE
jgi:hypothetical protein